jgi:hypothetical protein
MKNKLKLSDDSPTQSDEVIIAQEQDAVNKPIHMGLLKDVEGTLVLTNKRLIFACGDEKLTRFAKKVTGDEPAGEIIEEEAENALLDFESLGGSLFYSEIEDLKHISQNPKNLFIPLSAITSIAGEKHRVLGRPVLKISWNDDKSRTVKSTEFQERLTGESRTKNLNDWAPVIEQLKAGTIRVQKLPPAPPIDTLEGKIAFMMGDLQDKGLMEIEEEVEQAFKIELEPDDVEEACKKLVSAGFLDKGDDDVDDFYRKRSPVGIDGLSS